MTRPRKPPINERRLTSGSVFFDVSSNFHPYACDGPGKCVHCDRQVTLEHDPAACVLCDLEHASSDGALAAS